MMYCYRWWTAYKQGYLQYLPIHLPVYCRASKRAVEMTPDQPVVVDRRYPWMISQHACMRVTLVILSLSISLSILSRPSTHSSKRHTSFNYHNIHHIIITCLPIQKRIAYTWYDNSSPPDESFAYSTPSNSISHTYASSSSTSSSCITIIIIMLIATITFTTYSLT